MKNKTIVFGAGCFWCADALFRKVHGIEQVTSGYAGGTTVDPTYFNIVTKETGHIEVVKVVYDQQILPTSILLEMFFYMHDPTSQDKQQYDEGTMYRSIIFYSDNQQEKEIYNFLENVKKEKRYNRPIVTEVRKLDRFFDAESYHQDYYRENSYQPYCQIIINPKKESFTKKFAHYLKS